MFTGIVEEKGEILSIERGSVSAVLTIRAKIVLEGTKVGDSIAVNGVCLTVTRLSPDRFSADVMAETLRRSALGELRVGSAVNLERALAVGDRMGGHIVSGHIDGTGQILSVRTEDNAVWYRIAAKPGILRLIVEKGSITVDGISLTVAAVHSDSFEVSVIPHTREVTTLAGKNAGASVNLENDIIGKYVERLLQGTGGVLPMNLESGPESVSGKTSSGGLSMEFLAEHGML